MPELRCCVIAGTNVGSTYRRVCVGYHCCRVIVFSADPIDWRDIAVFVQIIVQVVIIDHGSLWYHGARVYLLVHIGV